MEDYERIDKLIKYIEDPDPFEDAYDNQDFFIMELKNAVMWLNNRYKELKITHQDDHNMLTKAVESLNKKVKDLDKECDQFKGDNKMLKAENKTLANKISQLTSDNDKLVAKTKEFAEKEKSYIDGFNEVKHMFFDADRKKTALKEENTKLQEELKSKDNQINAYLETIQLMRSELDDVQDKHDKEIINMKAEYDNMYKKAKDVKSKLLSQVLQYKVIIEHWSSIKSIDEFFIKSAAIVKPEYVDNSDVSILADYISTYSDIELTLDCVFRNLVNFIMENKDDAHTLLHRMSSVEGNKSIIPVLCKQVYERYMKNNRFEEISEALHKRYFKEMDASIGTYEIRELYKNISNVSTTDDFASAYDF